MPFNHDRHRIGAISFQRWRRFAGSPLSSVSLYDAAFYSRDERQRFCNQHQVKLGRLSNLFLTKLHADAIGGLLGEALHIYIFCSFYINRLNSITGMYLTLADNGVKRLAVHGPQGISRFIQVTITLSALSLTYTVD